MRKLADISAFERLQGQSSVSEIAVFNGQFTTGGVDYVKRWMAEGRGDKTVPDILERIGGMYLANFTNRKPSIEECEDLAKALEAEFGKPVDAKRIKECAYWSKTSDLETEGGIACRE